MKSVTFKFWVTLEFSRHHGNLKPKRCAFCIEYKPIDRTWPFHYQWLELFGLLKETGIKSSVAFFKCFSICMKSAPFLQLPQLGSVRHLHEIKFLPHNSWYSGQHNLLNMKSVSSIQLLEHGSARPIDEISFFHTAPRTRTKTTYM